MKKKLENPYSKEKLKKRRLRRNIRRAVFFVIFIIAILVTIAIKAPYFNVTTFLIENNNIVNSEEIIAKSPIKEGNNIFYFNKKDVVESIKEIPYIQDLEIIRQLPNTILFSVKEREAFFYGVFNNKFVVFDKDLRILEIRDKIDGLKLVRVMGLDYSNVNAGDVIEDSNERRDYVIKEVSHLFKVNKSGIGFDCVNLEDLLNIRFYYRNIEIRIGTDEELKDKLNQALNILEQKPEFQDKKGYIDVSFKGNPVVYMEK